MGFEFSVTIDVEKLRQKVEELSTLLPNEMRALMVQLEGESVEIYKSQVPVAEPTPSRPVTGRLKESVTTTPVPDGFIVGPTELYGIYPAYGTRPHVMTAKNPLGMRFWWNRVGGWVRAWAVSHPGQVQNPFHARAYRLIYIRARELVEQVANRLRT